MDLYHTTDIDGVSLLNPDKDALRELLEQLNEPAAHEAEHPDVALIHDPSGWSLSAFPSGVATLENLNDDDEAPFFMNSVSHKDVLQMWLELSRGEIESVRKRPWVCDGE